MRFHCLNLQIMDGMEWNMMESVPSNSIQISIFCFIQFGVYVMEWDIFNKITNQWSEIYITFRSAPSRSILLNSVMLHQSKHSLRVEYEIHVRVGISCQSVWGYGVKSVSGKRRWGKLRYCEKRNACQLNANFMTWCMYVYEIWPCDMLL